MGRVVVKSSTYKCAFKFNSGEELRKVLDALALLSAEKFEAYIAIDDVREFAEVAKVVSECRLFRAAGVALKLHEEEPAASATPASAEVAPSDVEEELVYRVVKRVVEEKLREGRGYFLVRELHVPIFGRELNLRDWRDDGIYRKLKKALKRILPRIEQELRVKLEEDYVWLAEGGKAARFKAYKIRPAPSQ